MIDAITSGNGNAGADVAGASGTLGVGRNETIDQQQFLMLFISQLQNQDPLNPLDTNALTSQLAQFSSLEQLFNINSTLDAVEKGLHGQESLDPLGFLGTEISVPGDTLAIEDGVVSQITADVPAGVSALHAVVLGPDGSQVLDLDLGVQPPGELEVVFDGKDGRDAPLPDGLYAVRVMARDGNDEPIQVDTFVRGRVTGIDLTETSPVLLLGDVRVPMAQVRAITSDE